MDKIKDIIPNVIQNMSETKPSLQTKIKSVWEEITIDAARHHTAVVGLKSGKLIINVDSPAWLFQMSLKKRKILEQLRKDIPEVSNIILKIGKIK